METKDKFTVSIALALIAVIITKCLLLLLIFTGFALASAPLILILGALLLLSIGLGIVAIKADVLSQLRMKRFVSYLDVMHEEDFLDYIARLLNKQGCNTTVIQGCSTGNVIIATKNGKQCQRAESEAC